MIQAQFGLARHRRADARALHHRDARSHARPRGAAFAGHWRAPDGPARRRRRKPPTATSSTTSRSSCRTSAPPRRRWSSARCRSAAARRAGRTAGGVETLRAIPWVFAWTQTRLLLPTWLGTGEALRAGFERGDRDAIRELYTRVAVLPLDHRPDRDGPGQDRRPDCRRVRPAARARRSCSRSAPTCGSGSPTPSPRCSRSPGARELLADNARAPPLDQRAQPVRRSDQPRADRAAAPPPPRRRSGRPGDVERLHDHRQRHRRRDAEYGSRDPIGRETRDSGSGGSRFSVQGSRCTVAIDLESSLAIPGAGSRVPVPSPGKLYALRRVRHAVVVQHRDRRDAGRLERTLRWSPCRRRSRSPDDRGRRTSWRRAARRPW